MKPDSTQILSPGDAEWSALLLTAKDLFQLAPWAWRWRWVSPQAARRGRRNSS